MVKSTDVQSDKRAGSYNSIRKLMGAKRVEPLFTVVIPCYNRETTIRKTIRSVLGQTCSNWKLLIIDDASQDRSIEQIKPFLQDARVKLIQLHNNVGISKVMNTALDLLDTPYFIQLDSDDWLSRSALKHFAMHIAKADPETALFYGNIVMMQKIEGEWKKIRYIKHRNFKDKYDFLQYLTFMLHPRCYRTEAVRSMEGWEIDDPFEGRIMEDRRMCLKLFEKYPIYWIDKYLYYRRRHKHQLTNRKMRMKRNALRRYAIERFLYRWGDEYKPVYGYRNGYLIIKKLNKK